MLNEFFEGHTAYGKGLRRTDCPYKDLRAESWLNGYDKARIICEGYLQTLRTEIELNLN